MTALTVQECAERFEFEKFHDHQLDCFDEWQTEDLQKALVFYPTGKGKTETMFTMVALRGYTEAVVIAPPVTHGRWIADGKKLGLEIIALSHAKFRQKDVRVRKNCPIIADEFHLLGGNTGIGWKKFDAVAKGMEAPVIMGSATPNYNDAERVYCIMHVLDPERFKGGYRQFLFSECQLQNNPFGSLPLVTGFLNYPDAAGYLKAQRGVMYLEDDAPDILKDIEVFAPVPKEMREYGVDVSRGRIIASQMEYRHRERYLNIVDHEKGGIREEVYELLEAIMGDATTPILFFLAHSKIARVLAEEFERSSLSYALVDGSTTPKKKTEAVEAFKRGDIEYLIGTATLATGTDGMDVMCDYMVILDDTDDASLRRQLVGRILPRGNTDTSRYKVANRFVFLN